MTPRSGTGTTPIIRPARDPFPPSPEVARVTRSAIRRALRDVKKFKRSVS